jgi:hypothetical protein
MEAANLMKKYAVESHGNFMAQSIGNTIVNL